MGVSVNEPADNDSVPSPEGVLKRAARKGHLHVVQWLLDQGATINFLIDGQPRCEALIAAIRGGHLDIVKLLIAHGADVNLVWAEMPPLDHAVFAGEAEVEHYLRSIGAKQADELPG